LGDVHAQLSYDVTIAETFKNYWLLSKPGIILGNIISAAGGFFLASKGDIDIALMIHALTGISLVIASGCVFNNFIDTDIDRVMSRTRSRTLARNAIFPRNAVIYAVILGISGLAILLMATNILCTALVVFGFAVYVVFYSQYLKRRSLYATYIGSIAGAVPPVAGYCAVTGHFDPGAGILSLIFVLWQIPHCYAFAIIRVKDYIAAGIPVAPVSLGLRTAKHHIVLFIFAFWVASIMLTFTGFTGYFYLGVITALSAVWFCLAFRGYKVSDNRRWAILLFQFSLICILFLSFMMSVDYKSSPYGRQLHSVESKYLMSKNSGQS
jgi:protoheme IX farnesyltransferase